MAMKNFLLTNPIDVAGPEIYVNIDACQTISPIDCSPDGEILMHFTFFDSSFLEALVNVADWEIVAKDKFFVYKPISFKAP